MTYGVSWIWMHFLIILSFQNWLFNWDVEEEKNGIIGDKIIWDET